MKASRKAGLTVLGIYAAIVAAQSLSAKPLWVKKAKDLGFPAENCLYCHTEKTPKKEKAHEQLNDRGKWLFAEKGRRNAKEVDLEWLKDYPADKK
jgi:hypothetical protein